MSLKGFKVVLPRVLEKLKLESTAAAINCYFQEREGILDLEIGQKANRNRNRRQWESQENIVGILYPLTFYSPVNILLAETAGESGRPVECTWKERAGLQISNPITINKYRRGGLNQSGR